MIANHKIMQLKDNHIPKGLVPLEKLFDNNYVASKPSVNPQAKHVEDCNIRTKEETKFIKLSKSLSTNKKNRYVDLFK
jgi:hypothetical protein